MLFLAGGITRSAESDTDDDIPQGDETVTNYFNDQTAMISDRCLANIHSLADWEKRRKEYRRQAAEMLGLNPMPPRTPLHPVITGRIEEKDFTVEKLYFQSQPHLYVTADLYLPKPLSNSVPAVLYLCGHTSVISDGVSYGNKTAYQHHGIWFARNGYVCLVIDTLQYGEILGHHRGTYDEGAWWWNSRGYTPAAVETWDAIRGLDYLDSFPEVDTNRIGVTGRSGGGAYSWFVAALDDRVKVIAPVAGITDLKNYCADGKVDDHCDCMFFVNTYRWDYPMLAALCAPRPLLLAETDDDEYFPLDGVLHTRDLVKRIYDLYGASTNFGLVIAPGPHRDTQDVQVPVFRWFNIHLKQEDPVIEMAAVKMFSPQELKVFAKIPADQINTRIEDTFEPEARAPEVPATAAEWQQMEKRWMNGLRTKCFAGWPFIGGTPPRILLPSQETDGVQYQEYEIESQKDVWLPLVVMHKAGVKPKKIFLRVADATFARVIAGNIDDVQYSGQFGTPAEVGRLVEDVRSQDAAYAVFYPRDVGLAWKSSSLNDTQLRRRFMLLGQTLDGMRVWDICRAVAALHAMNEVADAPLCLEAEQGMGVNALYASLFASGIDTLRVSHIPATQADGPDYLNVLKILDIPEAAAMAASRCKLEIQSDQTNAWDFLRGIEKSPATRLNVQWVQ